MTKFSYDSIYFLTSSLKSWVLSVPSLCYLRSPMARRLTIHTEGLLCNYQ
ncbi:hypothetical protein H6G27_24220 [Nostoc linckia FACHB-104]|nr:hypothetical protein [Nostoc linckia FACHB-104]